MLEQFKSTGTTSTLSETKGPKSCPKKSSKGKTAVSAKTSIDICMKLDRVEGVREVIAKWKPSEVGPQFNRLVEKFGNSRNGPHTEFYTLPKGKLGFVRYTGASFQVVYEATKEDPRVITLSSALEVFIQKRDRKSGLALEEIAQELGLEPIFEWRQARGAREIPMLLPQAQLPEWITKLLPKETLSKTSEQIRGAFLRQGATGE